MKIILSEYEKKVIEMEKDNNQSSLKLKSIIETLQKEKEELNMRLIKANHSKLCSARVSEPNEGEDSQPAKVQVLIKADESKSIIIAGTGII